MSRTKQNDTKPIMAVSRSTSKIKVKLHWTFMEMLFVYVTTYL